MPVESPATPRGRQCAFRCSLSPEAPHTGSQIVMQFADKHQTAPLYLEARLTGDRQCAHRRCGSSNRGDSVGLPVAIRISGEGLGDKQSPVVTRNRADKMTALHDVNNLYVYASHGKQKVPLRQVARMDCNFRGEVIRRRNVPHCRRCRSARWARSWPCGWWEGDAVSSRPTARQTSNGPEKKRG